MNQEIIFKICKTCNEQKEICKYRPRSLVCNKCVNKKDSKNLIIRHKRFYENHKERIQEQNLLNYYQNKYDNKNLTMHEVNLFKISGIRFTFANCLSFSRDSSIGVPKYDLPPSTDLVTPVCPIITALAPIVIPLVVPTCPQSVTSSSIITQPAIPV